MKTTTLSLMLAVGLLAGNAHATNLIDDTYGVGTGSFELGRIGRSNALFP
jgi:hypothetical protein